MNDEPAAAGGRTIFILSPDDRDGLCQLARAVGWRAIGARRPGDAAQRYLRSEAEIALVDLRGGESAELMVAPLGQAVAAGGGALVAIVHPDMIGRVPAIIDAGATHYLAEPPSTSALRAVFASARRLVERLGGGASHVEQVQRIRRGDALYWMLDQQNGRVRLSDGLARELGVDGASRSPVALLANLTHADRRAVLIALRRMVRQGRPAAFAHGLRDRPADRLVHHVRVDNAVIAADVEWLSDRPDRDVTPRDFLTGLRSRQAALEWLDQRFHRPRTLLLLSIGQFERMNAAYGQVVGDALLGRVARRVERMVSGLADDAVVARIAGTEFLVGLAGEEAQNERAVFLARQLIAAIGRPFAAGDHLIRLTARCGIAEARPEDDAARLVRRAGTALADARRGGGEGIRILTAEKRSRQVDADQLETDLRLALDRGEIGIVFQPQYPVGDERVSGVEALARWHHPRYGALTAGILFATAERSDYMVPLSTHIQAEALRQAAAWPALLSDLRLSINVTAADLAQPSFVPDFLRTVDGSGFPRARLTVEITESGLMEDADRAAQLLGRLRAEGLEVAVDDFGTGYSSLAYLKNLPLDYLKIDSGLAQDIAGSTRDRIIVRGVIHMAKSLGLKVVAEGVETQQQLDLLAHEGCDYYQGFLRSAGVPSAELAALVAV